MSLRNLNHLKKNMFSLITLRISFLVCLAQHEAISFHSREDLWFCGWYIQWIFKYVVACLILNNKNKWFPQKFFFNIKEAQLFMGSVYFLIFMDQQSQGQLRTRFTLRMSWTPGVAAHPPQQTGSIAFKHSNLNK